jgi:FkbM family methyltransferase
MMTNAIGAAAKRVDWRNWLQLLAAWPGARWLAGVLASAATSVRRRTLVRVTFDGAWVHHYRDGTVVSGRIGADRPSGLVATTLDIFLDGIELHEGDTVIDVGAGIGEETLTFARLVGSTGRVVAIEAHPLTARCLRRNIDHDRAVSAEVVEVAIGDSEGVILISDAGGSSVANRIGATSGLEVPLVTLDALADRLAIGDVALLKMNIEGAERAALGGMDELLKRVDHVCVSCHDFLADRKGPAFDDMRTKADVRAHLERAGFEVRSRDADPRPWVRDYLYGTRQP